MAASFKSSVRVLQIKWQLETPFQGVFVAEEEVITPLLLSCFILDFIFETTAVTPNKTWIIHVRRMQMKGRFLCGKSAATNMDVTFIHLSVML